MLTFARPLVRAGSWALGLVAAPAACLTLAATATGATVSYANNVLTVQAQPGQRDGVGLTLFPSSPGVVSVMSVTGFAAPVIGSGCSATSLTCPIPARLEADLLDGDDELDTILLVPSRLFAGLGNDRVYTDDGDDVIDLGDGDDRASSYGGTDRIDGGAGVDDINAQGANSTVDGGDGNDVLWVHGANSIIDGGRGDDSITRLAAGQDVTGGPGRDTLNLGTTADDLVVSLDDQPNDLVGASTGANVHADVEQLATGSGDDTLTGRPADDRLDAGAGDDELDGGAGHDTLIGGTGDDLVRSHDGAADTIDCGPGSDRVYADLGDATSGCESVLVDADADGTFTDFDCDDQNAAIHPGAVDLPGNGIDEDCSGGDTAVQPILVDLDHDGISPPLDCNDRDPAVHAGALEIPGNTVDENCDSIAAPFPRITGAIAYRTFTKDGRTLIRQLEVHDAPTTATVEVKCRGTGCPRTKMLKPTKLKGRTGLSLTRRFRGSRLRPGTVVEVRVMAPAWIGQAMRLKMRSGNRAPTVTRLCIPEGSTTPAKC
jgi:hypothetical protein